MPFGITEIALSLLLGKRIKRSDLIRAGCENYNFVDMPDKPLPERA